MKYLNLPIRDKKELDGFNCGEEIVVNGIIYTARDKVHSLISKGNGEWPFKLENNGIFYCGPTAAKNNFPLGSCGPTTSARMDSYTPALYNMGLAVTIGKGPRSNEVVQSIKRHKGLYLVAYGGCGALYGSRVIKADIIEFKEFGPQAVYRLKVKDFPVVVGINVYGKDVYKL